LQCLTKTLPGLTSTRPNIGSQNGVSFNSDANFKDLYGRFVYRFNLEKDQESRNGVQAAGPRAGRAITLISHWGAFYFYGRTAQPFSGVLIAMAVTPTVLTAREPYYAWAEDVNFNYRTFNLFGVYIGRPRSQSFAGNRAGSAGIHRIYAVRRGDIQREASWRRTTWNCHGR